MFTKGSNYRALTGKKRGVLDGDGCLRQNLIKCQLQSFCPIVIFAQFITFFFFFFFEKRRAN